jgi:hypothetical protein
MNKKDGLRFIHHFAFIVHHLFSATVDAGGSPGIG